MLFKVLNNVTISTLSETKILDYIGIFEFLAENVDSRLFEYGKKQFCREFLYKLLMVAKTSSSFLRSLHLFSDIGSDF